MAETELDKLGWLGRRRARIARKRRAEWGPEGHPAREVIFQLRQRARASLRRAFVFLVLLFLTVIAGLGYFLGVPLYRDWVARTTDAARAREEAAISAAAVVWEGEVAELREGFAPLMGKVWLARPTGAQGAIRDIDFRDHDRGAFVTSAGEIFLTADGGESWRAMEPAAEAVRDAGIDIADFSALIVRSGFNAVDYGDSLLLAADRGLLLRRDARTGTVAVLDPGIDRDLHDVRLAPDGRIWIAGESVLKSSGDGGATWRSSLPVVDFGSAVELRALAFGDGTGGMAVGRSRSDSAGFEDAVAEESGDGKRWQLSSPRFRSASRPSMLSGLRALAFDSGGAAWTAGADGAVLYRPAGSSDWQLKAQFDGPFNRIAFGQGGRGWMAGDDGRLLSTQDGGGFWVPVPTNVRGNMAALAVQPPGPEGGPERAWAGSDDGRLLAPYRPALPLEQMGPRGMEQMLFDLKDVPGLDVETIRAGVTRLSQEETELERRRLALAALRSDDGEGAAVAAAARLAEAAASPEERGRAMALLEIALRREAGGGESVWQHVADGAPAGILTLFLLSTLSALYRYNTRLAGFYHARADALELGHGALSGEAAGLAARLAEMLAADGVEFKDVRTPADQAAEIAKELAGRLPGRS
ncbi:hypothetical protein [Mangrovicoccus sp. HB161399]|uniref:WD40/YVTN/BNR-like repeat-containing protein n=1 Tax=Mangrovicoccus sp. HB161399 TaxID=2720392 RepID=UPI001552434A|nr:hypothetical protein [Mangrovicoccus sp. HB161399]